MKLRHQTKQVFTAALIVWMSGIVLFLCCDVNAAHAASQEIESCPLAKKGNCAKKSATEPERSFNFELRAFECCKFPAQIFDKARKLEKAPQSPVVAKSAIISAPQYLLLRKSPRAINFYQSFVFNRENTYLHNRVFRI